MRAISLATTVLIILAMSATHPTTLAVDRTVQPFAEPHERASMSAWIDQLQRAWLGLVLPGTVETFPYALLIPPPVEEEPTIRAASETKEKNSDGVILEDGAPF